MVRNRSKEKVCLVCWSITGGGGFRGKNGGAKLEESLLNQLKKEKKDKECDLFGKILNKLIALEEGGTDGRVGKDGSDVSVCSNCKTLVSSAIESKCKTLEVGGRVEKLQQSILEELKELQLYLDIFYLQMKKIENVMGKNDVEDLSGLIPGESSGGGLKDELLHFRDSLAKVMSDFRFYRDNVKKPMATVAQEGSQNMGISASSSLNGSPATAASQNGQGRRPFLLTLTPLNGSSGTSLLRDSQMTTGVQEANNLTSSTGISDEIRVSSRNFSQNGNANITPASSKKSPPAVDTTTSILNNKNGNSKSIGKKTPSPSTVIDLSSDENMSDMDTSPSSTSSQSKQPQKITASKPKAMQVNKDSSDAAVDNKSKTDSKKSMKRKLSEDKEYNSESDSEDSNDDGKKKKKKGRKSKKSKVSRKGTKVDSKTKAKVSPTSSTTSAETKQKLEKGKETTLPAKQNIGVPIVRRVSSRRNSSTSLHSPTTTGIEAHTGIPNEEKTRKEITSSESGKTAQSVLKNGKKSLSPQQQNVPVTAGVQCETNNGDATKSVVQQKDSNQIYTCGLCPAQHQSEKEHMLHMEQHLTEDFQSDTASELGQEKEPQLVLVTPAPTHKNVEDTGSKQTQQTPPKPTETNSGYKSTVQDVDSVIEDLIGSQIEYHPSVIDSTICISSAEKGGMRTSQEKEKNEFNAAEEIPSSSITIPGGESVTTVACSSTSSAISPLVFNNGSGKNQDGANGIATSDSPTSQSSERIQLDMGPPVLASEGNSKGGNADASVSLCIQDDGKNFVIN